MAAPMHINDYANVRLPSQPDIALRGVHVRERMDDLFDIEVIARSSNADLDLAAPIGCAASLHINHSLGGLEISRSWFGICVHLEQVRVEPNGLSTYRILIRPELWKLTQRRNHRLFQHMSIIDIVKQLLDEWSITHRFEIQEDLYPDIELRVQYGESDYHFLKRLLEEVGICFYFDAQEGRSVLVMSDAPQTRPRRPITPAFVDEMTRAGQLEHGYLTRVRIIRRFEPHAVVLRDHDYRRPSFDLHGHARSDSEQDARFEQYHYRPGDFVHERNEGGPTPVADDKAPARHDDSDGSGRAKRLLEMHRSATRRVEWETNLLDLSPGTVFCLEGHPHHELQQAELLALTYELEAHEEQDWTVRGTAAFGATPYRPRQVTEKPSVFGVQSALVVGPSGEEIYTDEYGRVRVQFHWDREGKRDDNSSCWMRVSQGWAGGGYGGLNVPRIGHEILVAFVNGNPDQPMVVGRIYNESSPVPYKLPENKTVSLWRSATSPTNGGFNEIRFEDAQGRELIYFQAQKDFTGLVKNNSMDVVGKNRIQHVRANETATTAGNNLRVVKGNESQTVGKNHTVNIGANRHTNVANSDTSYVGEHFSITMAPDMPVPMKKALDSAYQKLAPVLSAKPVSTLGQVPLTPLGLPYKGTEHGPMAKVFQSALPLMQALTPLGRKTLKEQSGPPPTGINMIDKKITLTTGGASIILNGADIILAASGTIRINAKSHTKVMSEQGDVLIQGGPMVRINPGVKPPEARCLKGAAREGSAFIGGAL